MGGLIMHESDECSGTSLSGDLNGGSKQAIIADVAGSFTYASYQNAIPVLRSIQIYNVDGQNYEKCRLELTSSPAFLRPKSWTIDRLMTGDILPLADRRVELDADYLAGLNEAERGEITLRGETTPPFSLAA